MITENTNISARVSSTLKAIVIESDFSHKEAYELGANLIALGVAAETKKSLQENGNLKKRINEIEYKQVATRKKELEMELKNEDKNK